MSEELDTLNINDIYNDCLSGTSVYQCEQDKILKNVSNLKY